MTKGQSLIDRRGSEDTPYIKIDSPSSGFGPIPMGKGVAYVYYSSRYQTQTQTLDPGWMHAHIPGMEDVVMLNIEGNPRPQPRPRFIGGRVVSTADANARRWKDQICATAKVAVEARGMVEAQAVAVVMRFDMPTPKADRHGRPHTFRPDADNLAKLALDAVMSAGLLKDDAAVSTLVVTKTWAIKGGLVMTLHDDDRTPSPVPASRLPGWIK